MALRPGRRLRERSRHHRAHPQPDGDVSAEDVKGLEPDGNVQADGNVSTAYGDRLEPDGDVAAEGDVSSTRYRGRASSASMSVFPACWDAQGTVPCRHNA